MRIKLNDIEKKCINHPIKIFSLIAFVVYILLFIGIHNRSAQDYQKYTSKYTSNLIKYWSDNGYFSHGGLWAAKNGDGTFYDIKDMKNKNAETLIYKSYSMAHLIPGNLLEQLYMKLTGRGYSHSLMRYVNQFYVLVSSVLLALIVFKLGVRFKLRMQSVFLSSVSCLIVFQTFPNNLSHVWEVLQPGVATIFFLLFLLKLDKIALNEAPLIRSDLIIASTAVFFAAYIDLFNTLLFASFLVLPWYIFGSKENLVRYGIKILLLPILFAITLFGVQLLTAYFNNPNAEFFGSGFYFRSGLDGSTEHYKTHAALITRRDSSWGHLKWPTLAIGGFLSFIGLLISYRTVIRDKLFPLITFALLGLYFPIAFILSQVVAIHPYYYDPYLAVTAIFLLFGIAPLILEKINGQWGGFSCFFALIAVCYVFVQLRSFMVGFPRIT